MKNVEINFLLFTFMLLVSESVFSAQALEEYKYDALGRLTQVKENQAVKTGYCYDRAGNRLNVNASGIDPEDCDLVPDKPYNLSEGSHQGGGCYWRWSAVSGTGYFKSGTGYFKVELQNSATMTIDGEDRYADHNTQCPEWIVACNDLDICSDKAYF